MDTDGEAMHLLLVEDDDGDALLVEELLLDAGLSADVTRAWSLEAALDALTVPVDCVLLDLGLPDASGLDALLQLRAVSDAALVVLTGLDGIDRGVDAVAAGAQDYLVKGRVDGETLGRAVRYAVERRRGERERTDRQGATDRGERLAELVGRLRTVPAAPLGVRTQVRTSGTDAELSVELWQVLERADGTSLALFGYVAGDGVAAAALATALEVSFRALAPTGLPLPALRDALDAVAGPGEARAHALLLELDPRTQQVTVLGAGGTEPLRVRSGGTDPLDLPGTGAPLGSGGPGGGTLELTLGPAERLLLLGAGAASTEETRATARRTLLDVLGAGGTGVSDDAVCDTVVAALRTLGADVGTGHVALLGWAPA